MNFIVGEKIEGYDFDRVTVGQVINEGCIVLKTNRELEKLKAFQIGLRYALSQGAEFIIRNDGYNVDVDSMLEFYKKGCDNYVISPYDGSEKRVFDERIERGFKIRYVNYTDKFQIIPRKAAELIANEKFETDEELGRLWIKKGISPLYLTDFKI